MTKFTYIDTKFGKTDLYGDKGSRSIHLRKIDEHITLSVPEVNGGQFAILFNHLKGLLPETEKIISSMHDMNREFKTACLTVDLKQGVLWDSSARPEYKDPWKDGTTFKEWCSTEWIAKEYYSRFARRKKSAVKPPEDEITIKSLKELLGDKAV